MKTFYYIIGCLLLAIHPLYSQIHENDFVIICGYEGDALSSPINGLGRSSKFSGNGKAFTPKGDMRVLIICAGFGPAFDNNLTVVDWPSAPDALPQRLSDKSTFYSNTSDFATYANAEHNQNISRFYYEMSQKKFRLLATVYPKRINIDATGSTSFGTLNTKVIQKMQQMDPNFNWSPYDNRTNPSGSYYVTDNSLSSPDMKPDYIVIIYRYHQSMSPQPVPGMDKWQYANTSGYASIGGLSGINYNGYTFTNHGYVQVNGRTNIYDLFIHEVAHSLYDCPHYAYANRVVGDYFYGRQGWGMMALDLAPFNCALGWERWYLNWIDIQANNIPADIKSASDLTATGEYILRDYMTHGDVIRIKIPSHRHGKNQYLWLENHQRTNLFDKRRTLSDNCNPPNLYPTDKKGVVAYIESINDDRTNPGNHTFEDRDAANAVKWLHPKGNYDYGYDTPSSVSCHSFGNIIFYCCPLNIFCAKNYGLISRLRNQSIFG